MNKKYAIRALKYAHKKLKADSCNRYVCLHLDRYVRACTGSEKEIRYVEHTVETLKRWISRQLGGDTCTFTSAMYTQYSIKVDCYSDRAVALRREWIVAMIAKIESGQFNENDKTPFTTIVKRLKNNC